MSVDTFVLCSIAAVITVFAWWRERTLGAPPPLRPRLQPVLSRTRLEVTGGFSRPPLERGPHVAALYETARQAAADLGVALGEGGTGGGSDGNFTAALGVPTLDGLGPRGDGAHARHEHVEAADLEWRGAFLAVLLARLGEVE